MKRSALLDDDSQRRKRARAASRLLRSLVATAGFAAACSDNHKVSPWGLSDHPTLAPYREAPDLDAQLARTDRELATLGLTITDEFEIENEKVMFVARRAAPADPLDWERVSTRVVTPYGVVFGAGPSNTPDRTQANDLTLPEGLSSPFFLLRSERRVLAILLRAADGHFAVYRLTPRGSTEVPIEAIASPRRATDADGDGYVDLLAEIPLGDPIGAKLTVVSTFDGAGFDDRSDAARGFHAKRAAAEIAEGTPADVAAALRVWSGAASGALAEKDVDAAVDKAFAKRREPVVEELRAWSKKMARRQTRAVKPPPKPRAGDEAPR